MLSMEKKRMRLKTLQLWNFQSHEATLINFDPHFNCIIGPSNVGKTAIFNALAFLFLNEWDGDFLRHNSDGRCVVSAAHYVCPHKE
jgi:predicted ATP-dependent endonuclease of OLD family